jgi:hypothetical protein
MWEFVSVTPPLHPQSIQNVRKVSDCHKNEKNFCAIPVNRLTTVFPQQNRTFTDPPHMVGKISFTTFRLRAFSNSAHTWGLSLSATPNLADG